MPHFFWPRCLAGRVHAGDMAFRADGPLGEHTNHFLPAVVARDFLDVMSNLVNFPLQSVSVWYRPWDIASAGFPSDHLELIWMSRSLLGAPST